MIAGHYSAGLSGWAGKAEAAAAWNLLQSEPHFYASLPTSSATGKRKSYNWQVVRKVLGRDIENIPQEIGDCVSWGARNAVEHLICTEILLKGDREKYRPIFAPYIYGISRVQIGGGRIGGDGSVGAWAAQGVIKYGILASDESGCPHYSGSVARSWGRSGPPSNFISIAKNNPVQSAAKVSTWEEVVAALVNGYPITVASNQGFEGMTPGSDGFHRPSGSWSHQMCIVDVDDEYKDPFVIVRNSWGDVHGKLTDFETGETLPVGCLRVRKDVVMGMIGEGDSFAYSNFQGFPEQPIAEELFKLI